MFTANCAHYSGNLFSFPPLSWLVPLAPHLPPSQRSFWSPWVPVSWDPLLLSCLWNWASHLFLSLSLFSGTVSCPVTTPFHFRGPLIKLPGIALGLYFYDQYFHQGQLSLSLWFLKLGHVCTDFPLVPVACLFFVNILVAVPRRWGILLQPQIPACR